MNNLRELFEIQAGLDAEILKNHPIQPGEDRLEKKHAALLVELGEMFNEWRAFKFWSDDQKPRTFKRIDCPDCKKKGYYRGNPPKDEKKGIHGLGNHWYYCEKCAGHLVIDIDPLLIELVDCLHFILSIGLELSMDVELLNDLLTQIGYTSKTLEGSFIRLQKLDWSFDNYITGFRLFVGFTEDLGYTWEQITEAYLEKNQENHYRQMSGY
jgi:dimeric dUTPase (all-alpha-NTP-PPase superfamily)